MDTRNAKVMSVKYVKMPPEEFLRCNTEQTNEELENVNDFITQTDTELDKKVFPGNCAIIVSRKRLGIGLLLFSILLVLIIVLITTQGTSSPPEETKSTKSSCITESTYKFDLSNTITTSKSAAQSSTYYDDPGYRADYAIDTNIDSFSHTTETEPDFTPWWRIDLYEPYFIVGLTIMNRRVHEPERLHDFEVRVGALDPVVTPNDLSGNPLCYFHEDGGIDSEELYTRNCSKPLLGRFLSIQIIKLCSDCPEDTHNILSLAQVYIFGCKP